MGESILQSCIDQIEKLGIPSNVKDEGKDKLYLTIVQQQSNSQNVSIEIVFQLLHDELSGKQLKEIKTILEMKATKEDKNLKLVGKFKEFGVDILSGIISGILTNLIK